MVYRRHSSLKMLLITAFTGGILCLIHSEEPKPQIWKSKFFEISVKGYKSPLCNPRIGDQANLQNCSLEVEINSPGKFVSQVTLPWETSFVENALPIDDSSILFLGRTQAGFEQFSIVNPIENLITFKQLALKSSLSPRKSLITYRTYQPPHGAEVPDVSIAVMSTSEINAKGPWKPRIIFDRVKYPILNGDLRNGSNVLCSTDLFWSNDSHWISFCSLNKATSSETVILASALDGENLIQTSQIDRKSLCEQTHQKANERCTVSVEQIDVSPTLVSMTVRTMGSSGYGKLKVIVPKLLFKNTTPSMLPNFIKGQASSNKR